MIFINVKGFECLFSASGAQIVLLCSYGFLYKICGVSGHLIDMCKRSFHYAS